MTNPLRPNLIRFIPACAGNTPLDKRGQGVATVHPRVCGEHVLAVKASLQTRGSSPRVRGTPAGVGQRLFLKRFIPACAGNTV